MLRLSSYAGDFISFTLLLIFCQSSQTVVIHRVGIIACSNSVVTTCVGSPTDTGTVTRTAFLAPVFICVREQVVNGGPRLPHLRGESCAQAPLKRQATRDEQLCSRVRQRHKRHAARRGQRVWAPTRQAYPRPLTASSIIRISLRPCSSGRL